ncbi:hypothetical protein FNV43_RR04591 [Rhamnella rubrinervis]|uniref:HMG box domain-containing protein n=1 Tax=Rhamnella rubrinervis TaxID=2594499 RepID=A0A8K0MQ82_9ROSA|nr:hypothetical protein FNV43_RR04591 [Rhamnella rubrinervis]
MLRCLSFKVNEDRRTLSPKYLAIEGKYCGSSSKILTIEDASAEKCIEKIFVKRKCEQLRETYGQMQKGQSFLKLAIDAWKSLSVEDRQPYIEESKQEKERFAQENEQVKKQDFPEEGEERDYHVMPPKYDLALAPAQATTDFDFLRIVMRDSTEDPFLELNEDY